MLYGVITAGPLAPAATAALASAQDHAAPEVVDVEVTGLIRRRVWQLRENVRTTDAYYVALAEALDVPLVTLDGRLARASGVTCQVIVPGDE